MNIKEFMVKWKNKQILADPRLPKYVELVNREVEKAKTTGGDVEISSIKVESDVTPDDPILFSDSDLNSKIPKNIKDIINQDYIDLEKFISGDEKIEEFNDIIAKYLKEESGWGVSLKVKGTRPGSPVNTSFISSEISSSVYMNFEDQVAFNAISPERLEKSRPGWIDRLLSLFSKNYYDKTLLESNKRLISTETNWANKNKEIKSELTIEDFFSQVKIKTGSEKEFRDYLKVIFSQISGAKTMGQTSLLEELAEKLVINVYEGALYANGLRRMITFEELENLADRSPRGLCVDLVQNFTRLIPADVIKEKEKADQLQIFDNYVILHFDPEDKGSKKTKEEITEERKKDPILFGLILDSQKLYYIADWIDEYCDLTWDKVLEILGDKEEDHLLKLK